MSRIIKMFQGIAIAVMILMASAQGHTQSTYVLAQDQQMKVEGSVALAEGCEAICLFTGDKTTAPFWKHCIKWA